MVGSKAVHGILKQAGSVQRAQEGYITIMSLWEHPENTDLSSSEPLEAKPNRQWYEIKVVYAYWSRLEASNVPRRDTSG